MELKFEVLASTTIKRKKPWPNFAWLSESEPPHGLYLLDSCRISQVSPTTGKTKKKLPSLASVQSNTALLSHSPNGAYLGGLTVHGDMFLWEKETDILESFVTPLSRMDSESVKVDPLVFHGHKLFISNSGDRALLIASESAIFIWELGKEKVGPVWWKIFPPDGVLLPDTGRNREAVIDAHFDTHPVFGKCCSCVFVFTSNGNDHPTTITHLLISWPSPTALFYSSHSPSSPLHNKQAFPISTVDSETSTESKEEDKNVPKSENLERNLTSGKLPLNDVTNSNLASPLDNSKNQVKKGQQKQLHPIKFDAFLTPEHQPFQTSWSTVFYTPDDEEDKNSNSSSSAPLTKRGCYVCKLSPTGSIAALAVNRKDASNTAVLFFSPLVDAGMSSPLYLSKTKEKTGRSYWVSDMTWLADGLLLACITKRGSVVILPRFGRPLKLVTHGHSLDMGPAVFLPLHPLITVSNASGGRKVKGHHHPDHSQSSEVDMLRQRFSVSAHPHLPVFLCSDGYSFTILRLLTHVPLSQLVTGLLLDTRRRLGLSPSSTHPISEDTFALKSSLNLGDIHDFAATLTDLEAAGLDDTLGSTLLSSAVGGGLFASLDAGAVQFAGMDSDLEQTQSLLITSTNLKKRSVEVATFQLRAAFGLLLSCGKLESGNGVYPQLQPLQHREVEKIQLEIQHAYRLFLSTFLTMMESSVIASRTELGSSATINDQQDGLFHELFSDVLSLVPLDSFSQSHLELLTALINGSLLTVLKSSMQKHKDFTSLSQGRPTIQLLKKFADSVCEDVSIVSELLESAMSVLGTTYSMRPLSNADSAFHTPLRSSKRRRHHSNVASYLSISLTNMLEVLGAFWQDIQACSDIANETISGINSNSPQHNRLQLRELGVLCKGLASSLQTAMTVLKAAHAQIRRLIHGGKEKRTQLQLETSQTEPSQDGQGQDGNPITLSTNKNLSLLLSKLEQCDLKGALEIVHSDDTLVRLSSFSATENQFNLNASTATLNSISHTHLSLASPSAQPVVACLAKVMMAFFSNQKLLIPPSTIAKTTDSAIQDPKPIQGDNCARLIELKRSEIVQAIRDQELSKVWTADCALEFALLGGLWEEATEFVADLGEWKEAVLLSLAYVNHEKLLREKVVNKIPNCRMESLTNLAHKLALDNIISLLGLKACGNEIAPLGCGKGRPSFSSTCSPQHCTEESFHSITGTLQVCAAGGVDSVLTKLVTSLIGAATACCQQLSLTVHSSVYLPAPPLYCPQPSIPEEEYIQCPEEYGSRYTIAHLVHSLVLVLRASNCLHSCAQWYCSELHKLTKVSGRTREAFGLPEKKLKRLPQVLSNVANSGQHFLTGEDGLSSPVVKILLASFRQLCGLLWFLHTRDQASALLRKLQPSLSKPDRDPDTVQKAAMWCCRLLPFAELFTQTGTKTPVDVQLTALSALSELPNDAFFANLLALYFPNSSSNDRTIDAKFQRLMSKLRSAHDPTTQQLLSVIYQTKSQKVLRQRDAAFGESDGHFQQLISFRDREQELFEHEIRNVEVYSQALNVGSFIFEYDVDYLNFLDTLFAVTLQNESYKPTTSKLMQSTSSLAGFMRSHTDKPDLATSPLTSEHIRLIGTCDSTETSSCWQHLLPLLHMLQEWLELPQPQQKSRQSKGKVKKSKDRVAMRVSVSLELVMNCLRQEEDRMAAELRRELSSQSAQEDNVKERTTSSLTSLTSAVFSSSNNDQTMHVDELECQRVDKAKLENSTTNQIVPPPPKGPDSAIPTSGGTLKDHTDGGVQDTSASGGFPLLQVPEGVLQGKLSHEAVQCALMASPSRSKPHQIIRSGPTDNIETEFQPHSGEEGKELVRDSLRLEKTTKKEPVAATGGDSETRGSSVVDVELTDSISTGEFPSDVTFSIGEIGSRIRHGDSTLHTTLGTKTLLLTGGGGHGGRSEIHAAAPQTSIGRDDTSGEKQNSEMSSVELEGADMGHDQSTSTLVNEDSVLTPTQSSGSVTALTLTEISQIHVEGTQSPVHVLSGGKLSQGSGMGSELKAGSQTVEPNTTMVIGDIVRSEMKKILEVQHQQLVSLLGGGVASSITPALSAAQTNQQQDAHTLVRPSSNHEAEPAAATTQPQAPSLVETYEEQLHVHSDDSMAPILNVDDLRSLTPSEPSADQTSPVTITIPPPPTTRTTEAPQNISHDHKSLQQSNKHRTCSSSSSIQTGKIDADLKVKASSTPAKPKKSSHLYGAGGRQKPLCLSDLDSESYSQPSPAGVGHMLSTSDTTETTDFDRPMAGGGDGGGKMSKKGQNFEKKMKKKSGLFTHSQQFGGHGSIQLLRLEPFDSEAGIRYDTGYAGREGHLEHEFPGLAKALKQFNDSVTPRFGHFASSKSKCQPAAVIKNMPLLQLPHVPDQAPPTAPPPPHVPNQAPPIAPPHHLSSYVPTQQQQRPPQQQARRQTTAVGGNIAMPLLIIPDQPQSFSAHPGSSSNIPPPQSAPRLPTTVTRTAPSSNLASVPVPTATPVTHTTIKPSLTHSSPHPTPSGGTQHSNNFKLPQVPIRPFVPILLPSHVLSQGQTATSHDPSHDPGSMGPQLLQLSDPLTRMKREGFKLLKEDPRDERAAELKFLHLERGPQSTMTRREQGSGRESKTNLPTLETDQTREQPRVAANMKQSELQVSSSGSLTTITSPTEESSEILPQSHVEKPVRTGRRQRKRRGKGVAWKMDQEKSENLQEKEVDGDVHVARSGDEVDYSQTVPPADKCTEVKPERQPLIGLSSGKTRSFPDEIPLQRLELRRLDMDASFIPSSPPQSQENVHTVATKVTGYPSNDPISDQPPSPAKVFAPKTSEIGIQVDPVLVPAASGEGDDGTKKFGSSNLFDPATMPVTKATVSSAVQVSPEYFDETNDEEKGIKNGKEDVILDSIEVTSVSSLDSEEVEVQLSDSDDADDNDGGLPSTEQQDEFTPPPLWYNSRSPIPIPTKTAEANSPILEDDHSEEAPPTSSSHFAGFSATPPPPLPISLSPTDADNQQDSSPKSHSQSPVPEILHQQQSSSIQMVIGGTGGEPRPRPVRSDVMERLQQLEEQLNAIESTAKSVEGEFKTTNQILFTIDRLQAVSDTLTAVTGNHGDGDVDIGLLCHDHSQAEISPNTIAPLSPPPNGSAYKLEDIAGLLLANHWSQGSEILDKGAPHHRVGGEKQLQDVDTTLTKLLTVDQVTVEHKTSSRKEGVLVGRVGRRREVEKGGGESQQAESESKSRSVHQDAKYLEEKDAKSPETEGHHTDRESGSSSLKMAGGGRGRGKEELRSWMTAKRRERLAQFVAEKDRLHKREKRPFQPPPSPKTGSYSVRQKQRSLKREKEKEFVAKRIEDAYTLMNDILSSKPTTSPPTTTARLPPKGRGRGGRQRKRIASGGQKKVGFTTSSGPMKRSQSDSKLYCEEENGEDKLFSNEVFGSTSSLHGTYVMTSVTSGSAYDSSYKELGVGDYRSRDTDMKRTQPGLSSEYSAKSPPLWNNKCPRRTAAIRKISSVDGLTEDEQDKIAAILASTDYDGQSVSSGSIVSNIDWDEVDRILDS